MERIPRGSTRLSPPAPRFGPPREVYRVGVIGTGAIGHDHVVGFRQHLAAQVTAIADISPERGRAAVDQYALPHLFTDYRQLRRRDDIDVAKMIHAPSSARSLLKNFP